MVYCSLKENTYYDSELNVFDYKLVDDKNNVIYFGHSVKNPKTGLNRINITEIVRDYLYSNLEDDWPELSNESGYTCQQENAFRRFALINGEITLEQYYFLRTDIGTFDGTDLVLSEPINGKTDPRMKIFWTKYADPGIIDYSSVTFVHRAMSDGTLTAMQYWLMDYYQITIEHTDGTIFIRTFLGHQEQHTKYTYDIYAGDLIYIRSYATYETEYSANDYIRFNFDYIAYGIAEGNNFKWNICTSPNNVFNPNTHLKDIQNIYINGDYYTLRESGFSSLFAYCTEITVAPDLNISDLQPHCYEQMFIGCTNLTNVPNLPAYTLKEGCYVSMFEGCTSITRANLPDAVNNDSSSLGRMFYGCSNLSYIKCMHSSVTAEGYTDWVYGVSFSGTFVKKRGVVWPTGVNGIPEGWTVEEADA